jgi:hypothetical protein
MLSRNRCFAVVALVLWSGFGGSPVSAELTPAALNTALIKAREEAREALSSGIKDTRSKTEKEFDAVKSDLPKAWKGGIDKAIQAVESKLNLHRIAILDQLKDEPGRVAPVAAALQAYSDTVSAALKGAAATFETQAKEFAGNFDAQAADAKDKAVKKFEELSAEIPKKLDAETAGQAFAAVQKANAAPSASEQLTAANAAKEKLVKDAESDTYNELRKQTGFSRIVRCVYSAQSPHLACAPDLLLSAAEMSDIVISDLPAGKTVKVSAMVARDRMPDTAIADCVTTSQGLDVSCGQIELAAGAGGSAFVSIYKDRYFFPSYGGWFGTNKTAVSHLRPAAYQVSQEKGAELKATDLPETKSSKIALLVSGGAAQVMVRVQVGDGTGPGELATASIPIGYPRFSVETGGFFAVTKMSDAVLVQTPDPANPEMVKILRIDPGNDYSQETGISLGFVPRNYPSWSLGVGFSTNGDRPVSVFVGPGFRLRTFGQRGLASISTGVALKSVKRFPGITEGESYEATSPLLNGKSGYKLGGYALLQLGFAFGPIPGAENGSSEPPK